MTKPHAVAAAFAQDRLADLFAPWTGARGILAAISGGPDSIALLHLLGRWRDGGADIAIAAATVDHRLRPESADEARTVADFARNCGIAHETLVWDHDNPASAIQERARQARYGLLADHAARIGADILMTAHHADDQAETILFRLIRGSGIGGLAGMATESERGALRLARPLLKFRKSELVALCQARKIPFAVDPGNADARFARPRLRRILPALEREGLDTAGWARLAARAARAEAALARMARTASRRTLSRTPEGVLQIDFAALAGESEEIALRVLLEALENVSPGNQVRLERAETLLARLLAAQAAGKPVRATLAGALTALGTDGILQLSPEPPRRRATAGPNNSSRRPKNATIGE